MTKIGIEVAHVTRDSDCKVKGQLAGGGDIFWRPPAQLVLKLYDFVIVCGHMAEYVEIEFWLLWPYFNLDLNLGLNHVTRGLLIFITIRFIYFYPHDAMRKRGLCCRPVSVCLSVCLSRLWIVSTRLKISSKFLFSPVAPSLWLFDTQRRYPIPRGTPSAGR